MKFYLYTSGLNMTPNRAQGAMPALMRYAVNNDIPIEVHYYDADVLSWFGTKENVNRCSTGGIIVIHADWFVSQNITEEALGDLCQKHGMLAVANKDVLITSTGRKGEEELLLEIARLTEAKTVAS